LGAQSVYDRPRVHLSRKKVPKKAHYFPTMADTVPLRRSEDDDGDDEAPRRSAPRRGKLASAADLASLPDPEPLPNRARPSLRQRIREANYGRLLCGPQNAACWPPLVCVCPKAVIPMRGTTWRSWMALLIILALLGALGFFIAASLTGWLHQGASGSSARPDKPLPGNFTYVLPANWAPLKAILDSSVDSSVSPCDDFFQHVCGAYLNSTGATSRMAMLQAQATAVIRQIAKEQWPLLGDWFDACMLPVDTRDSSAIIDLYYVVNDVDNNYALALALAQLHEMGIGAMWSWHVAPDLYNASQQVAYVASADGLLSPALMVSNSSEALLLQDGLKAYMNEVFALLPPDSGYSTAGAWNWSTRLAHVSVALDRKAPGLGQQYVPLSDPHNELIALGPDNFDWNTYWQTSQLFKDREPVADLPLAVLPSLDFLSSWQMPESADDWADLRAYLIWRLFSHFAADMDPYFVNAAWTYDNKLAGRSANTTFPQLGYCLGSVDNYMGDVVSHYYVDKTFGPRERAAVLNISAALRDATDKLLVQSGDWLDASTLQEARAKLQTLSVRAGYPDRWLQLVGLLVVPDDHLANVMGASKIHVHRDWSTVGTTRDPGRFEIDAFTVNAYYMPSDNTVTLTAAISAGTFFSADAPLAANMGGIGMVAGHELMHAVTGIGRLFDSSGSLRQWWSSSAEQMYQQRSQCFIEQYDQYTAYGQYKVDGQLTLNENLADSGGLRAAWLAYRALLSNDTVVSYAGVNYTEADLVSIVYGMSSDQLFYKTWALNWCSVPPADTEKAYVRLLTDVHAPPRWRINGPSSQDPDFRLAFGCPAVTNTTTTTAAGCLMF
jgi:putative endopeptidase